MMLQILKAAVAILVLIALVIGLYLSVRDGSFHLTALCLVNIAIFCSWVMPKFRRNSDEVTVMKIVVQLGNDATEIRIDQELEAFSEQFGVYSGEHLEDLQIKFEELRKSKRLILRDGVVSHI